VPDSRLHGVELRPLESNPLWCHGCVPLLSGLTSFPESRAPGGGVRKLTFSRDPSCKTMSDGTCVIGVMVSAPSCRCNKEVCRRGPLEFRRVHWDRGESLGATVPGLRPSIMGAPVARDTARRPHPSERA